ncbi:MAG: hypothetical protein H0V43_03305, partial [Gemmatimonadales bacterium]|nr:hypothetical protein [Gemmatimonadales bacterium]
GHTAGETMLLEGWARLSAAELERMSGGLPAPPPRRGPLEARLEGLLLFGPERLVL